MAKKSEEAVLDEPMFTKEQLQDSKKYRESADLIGALLVDGKEYSLAEVDAEIEKYKKKEVKLC